MCIDTEKQDMSQGAVTSPADGVMLERAYPGGRPPRGNTNHGLWTAHCQIAEHAQSGMMSSFDVQEEGLRESLYGALQYSNGNESSCNQVDGTTEGGPPSSTGDEVTAVLP
jgi:hypothetical protein